MGENYEVLVRERQQALCLLANIYSLYDRTDQDDPGVEDVLSACDFLDEVGLLEETARKLIRSLEPQRGAVGN